MPTIYTSRDGLFVLIVTVCCT